MNKVLPGPKIVIGSTLRTFPFVKGIRTSEVERESGIFRGGDVHISFALSAAGHTCRVGRPSVRRIVCDAWIIVSNLVGIACHGHRILHRVTTLWF